MKTVLERLDGFTLFRASPQESPDLGALGRFVDSAWRINYSGRLRFVYDERYFDWFLHGNHWTGLIAFDSSGNIAACLFTLFRELVQGRKTYQSGYVTALTVAPAYRGRGLAKWIAKWSRATLFEEQLRPIAFSMYHEGHGGAGAVNSSQRQEGNNRMTNFHVASTWAKRLIGVPNRVADSALKFERLNLGRPETAPVGVASGSFADAATYQDWIAERTEFAFAPSENFAEFYLDSNNARSGTLFCTHESGCCAIGYSRVACAIDDAHIGDIANIHVVSDSTAHEIDLAAALRHACGFLQEHGCIGVSLLDQGTVAHSTLEQAGFVLTQDKLTFSVIYRSLVTDSLPRFTTPVGVDFI
jgi:GNAT superfamily N-acetyltransferase